MNKKGSILIGVSALALMAALNLGHAWDNYGVLKGNLAIHVLAQGSSSSSGGDSSGGGSSSSGGGSSSSSDTQGNFPTCQKAKGSGDEAVIPFCNSENKCRDTKEKKGKLDVNNCTQDPK